MFEIAAFIVLLFVGYSFGSSREKAHLAELSRKERDMLHLAVRVDGDGKTAPKGEPFLVTGTVVIASDYFKDFLASLKTLIGGRLSSYETLLERARREATVRMKKAALDAGAREIVCARYQTTLIEGMGLEVMAYGTGIR
jgi:uncharacterized protein YbjQ (UPF0145 family)